MGGVQSKNEIKVEPMVVTPNSGEIRGGTTVTITGRGFITEKLKDNDQSLYQCKFMDSLNNFEIFSGRGTSSKSIECYTGNFKGKSGDTDVLISGPVLRYKGCWESSDVPKSFQIIKPNEKMT